MLVSWNWLKRYVDLPMSHQELADRLSMTGLNHESTQQLDHDLVIDLEVTSNRGDCLGHLGVAREISVLYELAFNKPQPALAANDGKSKADSGGDSIQVTNVFTDACPRYTARVIKGVKVGPSPAWLVEALQSIGVATVNNIVDVTNFVLMECGQPLHAFDLSQLAGHEIVVRPARKDESFLAIDHKTYTLDAEMCVIADRDRAVAIAGVMGGAETEVSKTTRDVLIESAIFTPLSVRRSARKLKLHSPSSFRFERRVDPEGVRWASDRACELILEVAGGTVETKFYDTQPELPPRDAVTLRRDQIKRLLGVEIPWDRVRGILTSLGCVETTFDERSMTMVAPSWRHDLTREVDLIEEVARIHGYDQIPDNSPIPVTASQKRPFDEAVGKIRGVLNAAGYSEAMTPSVVAQEVDQRISPWTQNPALRTETAMLKGARTLRRSIIPSLLESRYANQAASGAEADLFEVAHVYLPSNQADALPQERYCVAAVGGHDFYQAKGVVETLLKRLGIQHPPEVKKTRIAGLDNQWTIEISIASVPLGFVGSLCPKLQKSLKLERPATCIELSVDALLDVAKLVPQFQAVSAFPTVSRDLNLVVDESVAWVDLAASVKAAVGDDLNDLRYIETYRDYDKDGAGKKRILLSIHLQRCDSTLTNAQADQVRQQVVDRCHRDHGARLLA